MNMLSVVLGSQDCCHELLVLMTIVIFWSTLYKKVAESFCPCIYIYIYIYIYICTQVQFIQVPLRYTYTYTYIYTQISSIPDDWGSNNPAVP